MEAKSSPELSLARWEWCADVDYGDDPIVVLEKSVRSWPNPVLHCALLAGVATADEGATDFDPIDGPTTRPRDQSERSIPLRFRRRAIRQVRV